MLRRRAFRRSTTTSVPTLDPGRGTPTGGESLTYSLTFLFSAGTYSADLCVLIQQKKKESKIRHKATKRESLLKSE